MVKRLKTPANATPSGGTTARRDELREALLAAVERRVVVEGYRALRARDLAGEVGCAVGAIYNVFPDLDALIFAAKGRALDLLDRELATAVDAVGAALRPDPVVATGELLALAQAYLRFAIAHAPLWRMLFEHRPPAGTDVPAWYSD